MFPSHEHSVPRGQSWFGSIQVQSSEEIQPGSEDRRNNKELVTPFRGVSFSLWTLKRSLSPRFHLYSTTETSERRFLSCSVWSVGIPLQAVELNTQQRQEQKESLLGMKGMF
jgi:hypothetical protein